MVLMTLEVNLPQSDVCAFHPHTLHHHKACLEDRKSVSAGQMQQHVNTGLKVNLKFSYAIHCGWS